MNRSTALSLVALAFALLPSAATADTHSVDDSGGADFLTIGEAIAACSEGDTVYVMPGTYSGPLNRGLGFAGRNLVITSTQGWEQTLIDCEGQDRAFYLTGGQDSTTVIEGFWIVDGDATDQRSTSGGAICFATGPSIIIRDCVFDGNTATGGGAIFIDADNMVKIIDCSFLNNTATGSGGAVTCHYDNSIIRGCSFANNSAVNGGAVRLYSSSATLVDCVFDDSNTATGDGGAVHHRDSTGPIVGCEFTGNSAANGGGVHCTTSSPTIDGCDFTSNDAGFEGGGLLIRDSNAPPSITNCDFALNTAVHGGAADVVDDRVTFSDCTFEENSSTNTSGALYLAVDTLAVTNCTFIGNSTTGRGGAARIGYLDQGGFSGCGFTGYNHAGTDGGALHFRDSAGFVEDCTFDGNTADDHGGAIDCYTATVSITDCVFSGNSTLSQGGALCIRYDAAPTIDGCTIHDNTASTSGGGVYWDGSSGSMRTTTIEGNAAPSGGGIYFQGEAGTIEETIVAFSTQGPGIAVSGGGPEVTHCCVFGNAGGDSLALRDAHDNMFVNPLFCDAEANDYTLCADSPSAAANNGWDLLIGAHDIGCPECDDPVNDENWGTIKALFR